MKNDFNKALAQEVRQLALLIKANAEQEKLMRLSERLAGFSGELRGKSDPDLQLSASALVFSLDKLIFVEHPYQKEWLLPAGHVELGEFPLETALREFHEETGFFAEKEGRLVDVNLIEIPYNQEKNEKAHQHIDFRFLFRLADKKAEEAELPLAYFSKEEAPVEFQKYFGLLK